MADTICASQGPHNPRLSLDLLDKQQVAASKCIGTTEPSHAHMGVSAQGGPQLIIDAAQAHWHLDLLGRDERDVYIRAIPHKGKAGGAFNGNFAMDMEKLQAHNNNGYGLYLQSSIGGTLKDEVTLCTSLFWEYDDRPRFEQVELWQSTVGLKPTFQVDTGGKSIHNYLVLDAPMDPEPWTLLMERLQQAAPGCDKNCKGANRMMRMQGAITSTAMVNPRVRFRSSMQTARVIQLKSWMQCCHRCRCHPSPSPKISPPKGGNSPKTLCLT